MQGGERRVRLVKSISSLDVAGPPCQHACLKPECLHLAKHRRGKSPFQTQDQRPCSEHMEFQKALSSGTLCLRWAVFDHPQLLLPCDHGLPLGLERVCLLAAAAGAGSVLARPPWSMLTENIFTDLLPTVHSVSASRRSPNH